MFRTLEYKKKKFFYHSRYQSGSLIVNTEHKKCLKSCSTKIRVRVLRIGSQPKPVLLQCLWYCLHTILILKLLREFPILGQIIILRYIHTYQTIIEVALHSNYNMEEYRIELTVFGVADFSSPELNKEIEQENRVSDS